MLHLFQINGDRLAFDSESGALHLLDAAAFCVLQAWIDAGGQRPSEDVINNLNAEFGPSTDECTAEIEQAIADGLLMVEAKSFDLTKMYPEQPRIKSMCLHLCHDCNLRCRYCFAGTGDFGTGARSMLDLETGRKAVDFLIEASGPRKNLDIDFFGGEPLMNWQVVVALTEYCETRAAETAKNIRLTITTNAVLLDSAKTEFINQHFKNCVLSIDGRPAVHDHMRPDAGGNESYKRVVSHIRQFVAARGEQEYYLRGTYTRENLDFAKDVLHLGRLAGQVSIEPVVAAAGSAFEIRLEDVPRLEAEYEMLALTMDKLNKKSQGFNYFHFMIDLDGGPCAFKRLKGCGVGLEYCAVTPSGDIYPCHQFVGQTSLIMGNVLRQPVVLDPAVQDRFRSLLVPDKKACRVCWARYFCGGGCAANALRASGQVDGIYETGCALQKKRLECALWLKTRKTTAETRDEL